MKLRYLQLLCFFALALPFFTACKGDKEYVAPSNKALLVAHEWKGDQALIMGIDITDAAAIPNGAPSVRALRLTFKNDNTYVAKTGEMTFEGVWRFNEDETKIYFDFLGLGEFNVKKLTAEDLYLTTSISKSQLTLLAQILRIDLGVINRFPDGTEFETELRFIKA